MRRAPHLLALALLGCLLLSTTPLSPLQQQGDVERVAFEVSEGTRLAIDISPDGETVAFDLLGQIWLLPASGGKAQPVTDAVHDPAEDLDPSFSPDGKWIAFTARRPGGRGIWLLSASGGPIRRLTTSDNAYEDPEPAWSPDSSRLACVRGGALAVVDISSGATSQLQIEDLKDGPIRNPAWSRDGRQIAFVHGRAAEWPGVGPDPRGVLYVVPAEGGKASPLLDDATYLSGPAYSPDGKRLAFFVWQAGTGSQLWVADLAQRTKRRIELDGDLATL